MFINFSVKTEDAIEEVIVKLTESKIVAIVKIIVAIEEMIAMIDKITVATTVTIVKMDVKKIVITEKIAAIKNFQNISNFFNKKK